MIQPLLDEKSWCVCVIHDAGDGYRGMWKVEGGRSSLHVLRTAFSSKVLF